MRQRDNYQKASNSNPKASFEPSCDAQLLSCMFSETHSIEGLNSEDITHTYNVFIVPFVYTYVLILPSKAGELES